MYVCVFPLIISNSWMDCSLDPVSGSELLCVKSGSDQKPKPRFESSSREILRFLSLFCPSFVFVCASFSNRLCFFTGKICLSAQRLLHSPVHTLPCAKVLAPLMKWRSLISFFQNKETQSLYRYTLYNIPLNQYMVCANSNMLINRNFNKKKSA